MSNEDTPDTLQHITDTLNSVMEFDHVIRVLPGGAVLDRVEGVYSPERLEMEVDGDGQSIHADDSDIKGQAAAAGWKLLQGYTGQYSYSGPVMHSSEFIGGRMARDILGTPGYYVAVVIEAPCNYSGETECDIETGCDCEPAGWAVAFKPAYYCSYCRFYGDDTTGTLEEITKHGMTHPITGEPLSIEAEGN